MAAIKPENAAVKCRNGYLSICRKREESTVVPSPFATFEDRRMNAITARPAQPIRLHGFALSGHVHVHRVRLLSVMEQHLQPQPFLARTPARATAEAA
jgi:hypothetical protein